MTRAVSTFTAAAALAAAVVVSACAPSVDGRPVAGETRASSELKSGSLPAAPAAVQQKWEDVTGQGVPLPRDSVDGAQFSATPVPGAVILHAPDTGTLLDLCTAGPTVIGPAGPSVLTAGHCGIGLRAATQYVLTADDAPAAVLGTATGAVDDNLGVDSAIVSTAAAAAVPPLIADTWPVAGVLTVAGVQQLVPLGTPVCYVGTITAVRCGRLEAWSDSDGQLRFGADPQPGDSGSAVFVIDPASGHAVLVGILAATLEDTTDRAGFATYLDPALQRLDARALVDEAASVAVRDQPGYSSRVTTAG